MVRAPLRYLLTIAAVPIWMCCNGPSSPRIPSPERECASLTESLCILSAQCTLVLASQLPGSYLCRPARNACEAGFIQRTGTRETCEEKPGCTFQPGFCYCPPDLTCVCGGGPPPQCEPATG